MEKSTDDLFTFTGGHTPKPTTGPRHAAQPDKKTHKKPNTNTGKHTARKA